MITKTTMELDVVLLKAAKKTAVQRDISVSEMLTRALRVYISDPEGVEETAAVLTDKKAVSAILEAREARTKTRKGYYTRWHKTRGL